MNPAAGLELYAVTAPGLEPITSREIAGLSLTPGSAEPGGVAFGGTLDDVARANLWLRTASRVLVRVASFHARALGELERKTAQLPWDRWLPSGQPVRLRVTCRKSRLYHQKAVAERMARAIGAPVAMEQEDAESEQPPSQLVVARVYRDECQLSLDSSGDLLHRRGYRLATAKAPLRETLAAALLLAGGWDPATPLVDPFCGSGTIPIEAALLARRLAPGRRRTFAFQRWPGWTAERWEGLVAAADAIALPRAPAPIMATDRDQGAITAAAANAERAGVGGDIAFRRAALSSLAALPGPGALVSNPPYGVRVGGQRELRDLYARLGQVLRRELPGWRATLLVPAAPLEQQTRLDWTSLFRSSNGGILVRAISAPVPGRPSDSAVER